MYHSDNAFEASWYISRGRQKAAKENTSNVQSRQTIDDRCLEGLNLPDQPTVKVFNLWDVLTSMDKDAWKKKQVVTKRRNG
jgi:hypothetical protein